MQLTSEEIERYAPYHTMPAFEEGYDDYLLCIRREVDDVAGQAYDRGAECAMRRGRVQMNSYKRWDEPAQAWSQADFKDDNIKIIRDPDGKLYGCIERDQCVHRDLTDDEIASIMSELKLA